MKQQTRKRPLLWATLGLLTLALMAPQAAEARGHRGHRGRHGKFAGKRLDKMAQELGLDATTKAQIKQLKLQSRTEAKVVRQKLRTQRQQLRALMQADSPNEAAVLAQVAEMNKLKLQLRTLRIKSKLAMLQLLTPEQRTKLKQLRAKRRAERKARFKSWRQGKGKKGRGFGGGQG